MSATHAVTDVNVGIRLVALRAPQRNENTQPIDAVCFRDNPNTFVHVFLLSRVLYILYALACVPDYPQAKAPRRLAIEAYIGPLFTT